MFCIKCGVKLVDGQIKCPLCGTEMRFPEFVRPADGMYPRERYPSAQRRSYWPQIIFSAMFLLPMLIVTVCNLQLNRAITWSGFVIGALLVGYVIIGLPVWFRNPNPVIFTPCGFAAVGLYLLYIDLVTKGGWFLSFAFPAVGGIGLIVTAVVTLVRYVRRGMLYIFGGAAIALGAFMLLLEFLMVRTFRLAGFVGWSLYPLVALVCLGALLICLAICRPAREIVERKLFL